MTPDDEPSDAIPVTPPKPSRRKRIVSIVLSVGVSTALVVWILRSIEDPEAILEAVRGASIPLLLAILPVSFLSHWLRATRWRRFLGECVREPGAPDDAHDAARGPFVTRRDSFASIMLGYAVNLVIPRGGEVARVIDMNRRSGAPAARLIATLFAERIIDLILLLAALGISLLLEGDRIAETFPAIASATPIPIALSIVGVVGIAALAFAGDLVVGVTKRVTTAIHPRIGRIATGLAIEAKRGFAFVRDPVQGTLALLETIAIWVCYWYGMILGLQAFGILDNIGLAAGTVVFSLTSTSVLVPSQGSIGVYHKFGEESMTQLYNVPAADALACVTVVHALLFLVVGGLGAAAVWLVLSARRGRP